MAEVAGLALGVASLLIATIESYEKATTFFTAVKNYPRKLREAIQTLKMQELCFRKANEQVLCQCVDTRDARQMLRDAEHPGWVDQSVLRRYIDLLGGDQHGFEAAVALICDTLDSIRNEFDHFVVHPKMGIKAARKQLRFAFEQSRIERLLHDLSDKTQNFIALTNLLTLQAPYCENPRTNIVSVSLRKEMQRFSAVKSTAEDLYSALGTACTEHDNHQAYLSLSPIYSDTKRIRFTLAFSQFRLSVSDPGVDEKPLWLIIESSVSRTSTTTDGEDDGLRRGAPSLKRALVRFQDDNDQDSPKEKKRLPLYCQKGSAGPATLEVPLKPTPPTPTVINLCRHGQICHHLAKFTGLTLPSDQAVGYLEKASGSKHLIYLDCRSPEITTKSLAPGLQSLQDVLGQSHDDDMPASFAFSICQRLVLAKQLAQAVLHFHQTAWLQNTWDSRSILVRNSNNTTTSHTASIAPADHCPEAFATTQITRPCMAHANPPPPNRLVIRNQLLFSLGVVLLELAYGASLSEMVRTVDQVGTAAADVPYRAAERLAKLVSRKWGPRYGETVRKCLHCDFGCGFDLGKAGLQEAFYRGVICELGGMAESLARGGIR